MSPTTFTRVAKSPDCHEEKNDAGSDSTRIMTAASSGTSSLVDMRTSTMCLMAPTITWANNTPTSRAATGPIMLASATSTTGPNTTWLTIGATKPSSVAASVDNSTAR